MATVNGFTFNPNFSGSFGTDWNSLDLSSILGSVAQIGNSDLGYMLAGITGVAEGGSAQQKANAVQSLTKGILSFLEKLGTGESASASSEVAKNEQSASQAVTASEEQVNELNEKFKVIQGSIDKENKAIAEALNQAAQLQQKEQEQQKAIEDAIVKVEELKAQLANATEPSEQKELLTQIAAQVVIITGAAKAIIGQKSNMETISNQVKDAYTNLTNYSAQATETQENGIKNLETIVDQAKNTASENAASQAQAPVNQTTSIEAGKAAASASTNPLTGVSVAPKLYAVSADQGSASHIRTIGSATVWAQITKSASNLANGAEVLTNFGSTIGSALGDCESLIGEWNTTVEPMITAFGSIEDFQKTAVALGSVVNDDMGTLETNNNISPVAPQYNKNYDNENNVTQYKKNELLQNTFTQSQQETENNLQTPKTKKLEFGL